MCDSRYSEYYDALHLCLKHYPTTAAIHFFIMLMQSVPYYEFKPEKLVKVNVILFKKYLNDSLYVCWYVGSSNQWVHIEDCLSEVVQFISERRPTRDLNQQRYTLNAIEEINCNCSCYRLCSTDKRPSWPIWYGQSCSENIFISTWNAAYHSCNTRPDATSYARSTNISY